jgi:hypothetical protein
MIEGCESRIAANTFSFGDSEMLNPKTIAGTPAAAAAFKIAIAASD